MWIKEEIQFPPRRKDGEQTWTVGNTQRVFLRVFTADPLEKLRYVTTLPVPVRVRCRSVQERYEEAQNSTTKRPDKGKRHRTIQLTPLKAQPYSLEKGHYHVK